VKFVALASGQGSNLAALLRAEKEDRLGGAQIVGLVVNRPNCGALQHAADFELPALTLDHRAFSTRAAFEAELLKAVAQFSPDALVLAGFMRILTPYFLDCFAGPLVNLHPALLPAFPGAHAIDDAFKAQVRMSGCSTHLVNSEVDGGALLMQAAVPLHPSDTIDSFSVRMHAMEHRLLPATLAALAQGQLRAQGDKVICAKGFVPSLLN
jgi:phosphoribosylglycinamide formyltransferase-1